MEKKQTEYYINASKKRIKVIEKWLQTNSRNESNDIWLSFAKSLERERKILRKLEEQLKNPPTNQLDIFYPGNNVTKTDI